MRSPFLVACALGLTLMLGACSSTDAQSGADRKAQKPGAPTASAAVADPVAVPTGMAEPGEETPAEFIKRWQRLESGAQNTGDPAEYLAITLRCTSCQRFASSVRAIYAAGGYVRYPGSRLSDLTRIPSRRGTAVYEFVLTSAPSIVKMSRTARPQKVYGGADRFQLVLTKVDGAWRVSAEYRLETRSPE